jgi:TonB family protein
VRAADTVPRVTVIRESMLVGFDSAAIEAIVAGNAIRSALDSAVASDSLRVDVRFSTDSLPGAVRLFSTRFPRMPIVDAAPRSSNPAAAYPEAAMADSLSGEVVLRFVVGRDGTPEFRTVELVRATARAFVQAALEALDRQRFTPATIHGCAVAQQIDYPFTFVFPESPPRH